MGFFSKDENGSTAIFDIQASSVGGAYVFFSKTGVRTMCYSNRVPFEIRDEEDMEKVLARALETLLLDMTQKGAPLLHRETGSGHVQRVVVSISTPWQDTTIQTHDLKFDKPRTVTKAMLMLAAKEKKEEREHEESIEEMILSVTLNGYEIPLPFGKQASRVEFTLLTSSVPSVVLAVIHSALRKTFHAGGAVMVSYAPVAYVALSALYPFEKDFLVITVSERMTDIAQCRAGVLVACGSVPRGSYDLADTGNEAKSDKDAWRSGVHTLLEKFSRSVFLPKTVFLVADLQTAEFVTQNITTENTKTLWLSEAGPTIIPLTANTFSKAVTISNESEPDTALSMIALYDEKRFSEGRT